ncbi:hypothetical protein LSUE1_G002916 [Lachnellula suecica]|uniref:Uncharacterized protein n=1 Tax=Lachnellula suecica TaxID=602035 RepID=A0A8T9CFQ8_9HELO|nr:hypothetical protein LSUE1_G002916 [Lachnellula suecica]
MATLSPQHPTSNITHLTDEINLASKALDVPGNEVPFQEKQKLLTAAKDLVDQLEGPEVGIWKVVFGSQANAALRTAFEMRIFEEFDPSVGQITAQQLAEKTGVEKLLLGMDLRGPSRPTEIIIILRREAKRTKFASCDV